MTDKSIYIPNDHKITPSADYNYWLNHLVTKLNKPTNKKSLRLLGQQIRKRHYKTLGTCVIDSPMYLLDPDYFQLNISHRGRGHYTVI